MKSKVNKFVRYRLIYPALLKLPFLLAYRLVSRLKNPLFEDAPEIQQVYLQGMQSILPDLRGNPDLLAKMLTAHAAMRSRDDLDGLALPKFKRDNISEIIQFSGMEAISHLKNQGRGVIIVMSHYGRPLLFSCALALAGVRHGMLTQTLDSEHAQLDSEEFNFRSKRMRNLLSVAGDDWFTLHSSMRPLYEALQNGKWVIIMCDLFEANPKSRMEVPFLGGRYLAANGIVRLAKKTGALLVYGVGKEQGRNVQAELRPLPEDPEDAMAAAFLELEKDVLEHPWQWWHWHTLEHAWVAGKIDSGPGTCL